MPLTIENFWRPRLAGCIKVGNGLVAGWRTMPGPVQAFVEAPLTMAGGEEPAPDNPSGAVLLVSAPGAVGKSTLARQIAHSTNAVYIDLAEAATVGGYFLTGGLTQCGLFTAWCASETTLLIDGLDEARLRVTQEAFEAFLEDVARLSGGRSLPIVLFGRTSAVQDTALVLLGKSVEAKMLEIGFYDQSSAIEFVEARLRTERPDQRHRDVELKAIAAVLARLRERTEADGDRFAGYAPVLTAVADCVTKEGNAAALLAEVESGGQPVTLDGVVRFILERDRAKLQVLAFEDPTLGARLYTADEQLDHCIARVFHGPAPVLPAMSPADAQTYSEALSGWLVDHPFLNGNAPSSAVFDAVISVQALGKRGFAAAATERELARGAAANPFLSEFYLKDAPDDSYLPPGHVGILFASMRARLAIGDSASLLVEGPDDATTDKEKLGAEVEVTLSRAGAERPKTLRFRTDQIHALRLAGHVEDVELVVPYAVVEIGTGSEAVIVAPTNVQCGQLRLAARTIIVERSPAEEGGIVFLEAGALADPRVESVPMLRGGVSLKVSWPDARAYPWTAFATSPTPIKDPKLDEALRRFRRFVTAFRSHSKGSLARLDDKIQHARMTKGSGRAVLDLLVGSGILRRDGSMFRMDSALLGSLAGATYADCVARNFSPRTIKFVSEALRADPGRGVAGA